MKAFLTLILILLLASTCAKKQSTPAPAATSTDSTAPNNEDSINTSKPTIYMLQGTRNFTGIYVENIPGNDIDTLLLDSIQISFTPINDDTLRYFIKTNYWVDFCKGAPTAPLYPNCLYFYQYDRTNNRYMYFDTLQNKVLELYHLWEFPTNLGTATVTELLHEK